MKAAALVVILSWPYWGIEQEGRIAEDSTVVVQGTQPMTDAVGPNGRVYRFDSVDFSRGARVFVVPDLEVAK